MARNEELGQGLEACEATMGKVLENVALLREVQIASIEDTATGIKHLRAAMASFESALGSDARAAVIGQTITRLLTEAEEVATRHKLQDSTNDNAVVIASGIADARNAINRGLYTSEGHKVIAMSTLHLCERTLAPIQTSNTQLNLAADSNEGWQDIVADVQDACEAYRENL